MSMKGSCRSATRPLAPTGSTATAITLNVRRKADFEAVRDAIVQARGAPTSSSTTPATQCARRTRRLLAGCGGRFGRVRGPDGASAGQAPGNFYGARAALVE